MCIRQKNRSLIPGVLLLLVALGAWPADATAKKPPPCRLEILVTGFRNTNGVLRVALFSQPKGFPEKWGDAVRLAITEIAGKDARVVFRDIPPGEYAVSVLHDEDNDAKLRTNFLGMPREGYGASGEATPGKPRWEKAVFPLHRRTLRLRINLSYR